MTKKDLEFYKGKKVLITGHTGFKGSWLCQILIGAGAEGTGYSLEPPTTFSKSILQTAIVEYSTFVEFEIASRFELETSFL